MLTHRNTSRLRLGYREFTERVITVTVSCQREQLHFVEGLVQQSFIGTEARVFHDISRQRIMKYDAGIHKGMCTHAVLQVARPCSKASVYACHMN